MHKVQHGDMFERDSNWLAGGAELMRTNTVASGVSERKDDLIGWCDEALALPRDTAIPSPAVPSLPHLAQSGNWTLGAPSRRSTPWMYVVLAASNDPPARPLAHARAVLLCGARQVQGRPILGYGPSKS